MDDYAGAFDPSFELGHLSRAGLATLGREYLLHGHLQDRVGMPTVLASAPREAMEQVAIVEWMGARPIYSRRKQPGFKFAGGNVPTIMKNLQLDIGAPHQFMDFRCRVDDAQHGEFWLAHSGALMDVEPMGEEFVRGMCHTIEDPTFDATALATHPHVQIRPIHRPPRVPAGREPHCHWTVIIDDSFPEVPPHPNEAIVARSVIANVGVAQPTGELEPGGWDDYDRDFDPDFELQDLSHRALVAALQEFAIQSPLLFRAFLLAVEQEVDEAAAVAPHPEVFHGLGRPTAQRLKAAM